MNRRDKDTRLEATPILFGPQNIVERLDWAEVFAKPQPIEVDLGCGDGSFLLQSAKGFPDRNFLGVERLKGRAVKAARKIERAGLMNARVVRIESSYAVEWLFPVASVAAIHILFPDPWPKRRHWGRRLIQTGFVAALWKSLAPRGEVHFATDHKEYFDEAVPRFGKGWERVEPTIPGSSSPSLGTNEEWRTDFERDFVKEGRTIYRARFVKRD